MTAVLERLAKAQEDLADIQKTAPQKQAEAIQKLQNPSSPVCNGVSVFNPRGDLLPDYAMPKLVCEIHAPHKIHPNYHGLDREEVELCNLLIAQGQAEYMIELRGRHQDQAHGAVDQERRERQGREGALRHGLDRREEGTLPGDARVLARDAREQGRQGHVDEDGSAAH